MNIAEILSPDRVSLGLDVSSRKRVLESLSELLANSGSLSARAVLDVLFARERLGSTALGHGVVLPHGRLDGLDAPVAAILTLRDGTTDFEGPDGEPVDLVFGLLVPTDAPDEHLQILAQAATRFSDAGLRARLRAAQSAEGVLSLFEERAGA